MKLTAFSNVNKWLVVILWLIGWVTLSLVLVNFLMVLYSRYGGGTMSAWIVGVLLSVMMMALSGLIFYIPVCLRGIIGRSKPRCAIGCQDPNLGGSLPLQGGARLYRATCAWFAERALGNTVRSASPPLGESVLDPVCESRLRDLESTYRIKGLRVK